MAYDKAKNEAGGDRNAKGPVRKSDQSVGAEKSDVKLRDGNDARDICRNYVNNRCKRGADCRYKHPTTKGNDEGRAESPRRKRSRSRSPSRRQRDERREFDRNVRSKGNTPLLSRPEEKSGKWLSCCRDFIKGNCQRTECRFLHVGQEDEDFFMQSGEITKFVTEQAVRILLECDAPLNGRAVCKGNIQGRCSQSSCRSRHMNLVELEREVSLKVKEEFQSFLNMPAIQPLSNVAPPQNVPLLEPAMDLGRPMEMNQMGNNFGPPGDFGPWADPNVSKMPMMNNMNRPMANERMGMDMPFNKPIQAFPERDMMSMQKEVKESKLKLQELHRVEEAKAKVDGKLKIADTEIRNLKDSVKQAEEMSKHHKQKFDLLSTELKEMDASKLKLGILARRVLGDIPAIEAKLIQSWQNQMQMNPEMGRWQEVCQNLRSLVQNILGVDVGSFAAASQQTPMSSMSDSYQQSPSQQSGMGMTGMSAFQSGMQMHQQQYGSADSGNRGRNDRSRSNVGANLKKGRNQSPDIVEDSSSSTWGNTVPTYGGSSSMFSSQNKKINKSIEEKPSLSMYSSVGGSSKWKDAGQQQSYWTNQDENSSNSNDQAQQQQQQQQFWTGPQDMKKSGGGYSYNNGSMTF